jgi:hypothetical protein
MSMGGSTPEILTTLTTDIGKVLDGLHRTKIRGTSHFSTGINVAAVRLSDICLTHHDTNCSIVGAQASPEQITEAADSPLYMQSDRRGGEGSRQAVKAHEEERHKRGHHCIRRARGGDDQEA